MFIIPIYLFSEIFPGVSRGPICSSCTRAHSPVWPPLISNMSNYVTISVYWVKLGSVPIGTLRKLSSPPVPPEWSPRPPSERGTHPPPGLATENDLYDNNCSVSSGFVWFRGKGQPLLSICMKFLLMTCLTNRWWADRPERKWPVGV